jgi:cobalt-zinc-cadmium efflux system outer membrane protein
MNKNRIGQSPLGLGGLLALLVFILGASAMEVFAQEPDTPPDLEGRELILEVAIDLALQFNPGLKGFAAAENEALARAEQAGRGFNPELGLEVENFIGSGEFSGFSSAEYTLFLAQTFQLGGKLSKQREAAGWNAEMVRLEARLQTLDLQARVTRIFVEILTAQQEVSLARELVRLAEQDLAFVERRVKKGATSPVEISRAQVALFSARMVLDSTRQALRIKKVQLSTLWNTTTPTFGTASGSLESVQPVPDWKELIRRLDQSPRLKRMELEAGSRRAELAVLQSQGKIDLTASAGIRHFSNGGDNAAVAAISIPLPVRNRNQDGIRAGQYGLDQVDAQRQSQLAMLREDLAGQHEQMTTAYIQVVSIRDKILPASEQALTQTNLAYRKGLFTLTDVISVRRTWFELSSRYFTALASYQSAAVEIARILGEHQPNQLNPLEND